MPTSATYRRRRIVVGLLAVVLVTVGLYAPLTLLAPLHGVKAAVTGPSIAATPAAQLSWPSYGASAVAAVGYPQATAAAGRTDAVPMASISKVVTAMVVLEAKPLPAGEAGPTITMTSNDVALYNHYLSLDGDVVKVQPGFRFTELDLLKLALIKSANNYAGSLALWAFGSSAAYADAATAWLAKEGLTGIHVVEPTGIDPRNVATASDLVKLGELALKDPVIAPIVSSTTADVPNVGGIKNTNTLLGKDGIDGIKTGTLNDWGANLLFASDHRVGGVTITIVGVVLGGRDHATIDRDIRTLIGTVVSGFHRVTLATEGQKFGSYRTPWGDRADLVATKGLRTVVWSASAIEPRVSSSAVTTGVKGKDVGTVRFVVAGTTLSVPLELSRTIDDPGWGWRLGHPGLIFGGV